MDPQPSSRLWTFAGCLLDERTLELKVGGTPVELERKQLEVLLHLLRHAGEVVTKDELAEAVWPGRIITDSNLTKTMAVLRAALGDSAQAAIKTVHGYGYRLVAPVSVQAHETQVTELPARLELREGDAPPQRPQWRLHARLGAGGQGEVWLAHHAETREPRVFKFAGPGRSLTALKREITLNRLLHDALPARDDFARLLGWNTETPPMFVEREYVAGGSVVAWSEARGGLRAVPLAERLEVLAQIAEALAAAHSIGVLHKDLKPANVLVSGDADRPRIKLCDFGSGALVDPGALAAHGITRMGFTQALADAQTSGTPLFLAPEVLAGQPFTVKSDVYALGVLLYQLVAGDLRRALAPGWEKDVPDELLREDIALAAAGDPADRLADAAELARRVRALAERHRQRETDRATQAQAERARLLRAQVRRLRGIAAVLLVATGVATASVVLAVRARDDARRSAAAADAVSEFLNDDLLAGASPLAGPVRRDLTVREVLDRASRTVGQRFAGHPQVAARVHTQLGTAYGQLNDPEGSRAHFQRAVDLYGADTPEGRDASLLLAQAMVGQEREKCALRQSVVAGLSATVADDDVRLLRARSELALCGADADASIATLRDVLAKFERSGATRSLDYERTLGGLARKHEEQGDFVAAEAEVRRLLELLTADLGPSHFRTARWRSTLAEVLINTGRLAEADVQLQRALHDMLAWSDGQANVDAVYGELALLRIEQRRFREAEDAARKCLGGPLGADLTGVWPMLVEAVLRQGRFADAAAIARDAVQRLTARKELRWYELTLFAHWADALRRQGNAAEARVVLARVTPQQWQAIPEAGRVNFDLVRAHLLVDGGEHGEARALLEASLKILIRYAGPDHWRVAEVREELAALGT